MANEKFYIVAADALPEVFLRVAEARRMLQVGEADTVGEAACKAGISRSAFYKYKDAVQPFQNMKAGRIITFYTLLKDTPGALSNILSIFANSGANILTINQTIPTNGCAGVTVTAETSEMHESLEEMMTEITAADGVLKFEILAARPLPYQRTVPCAAFAQGTVFCSVRRSLPKPTGCLRYKKGSSDRSGGIIAAAPHPPQARQLCGSLKKLLRS